MSSPNPPPKRRRIDAASATLKKPFKSPLVKRPEPGEQPAPACSPITPAPQRKLPTSSSTPASSSFKPSFASTSHPSKPALHPTTTPSRPLLSPSPTTPKFTPTPAQSSLLATLRQTRLLAERTARETSARVELLQQAAKIQQSSESNEKLEELVRKWKGACRLAAEELFDLIKDRVGGMGGGDAWRETRRNQLSWGWEDGEEGGKRGEGVDEREELEGREEDDREGEEVEDEGKEFTMHMMLKSLNIEPEVVGYDPVEDTWADPG